MSVSEHDDLEPMAPEEPITAEEPVVPAQAADAETPAVGEVPVASESRPRRRFTKALVAAAILGVLVLLTLPVFSTLQPGYYGRYPQLRGRMDNWRVSTHARVSCVQCHVEPGPKAFAVFAVRSIPAFYSQLVRGPHETNLLGEPSMGACQKCHTGFRQVSPDGDLLIPHRAHVQVLGVECVGCHKDLVHSLNDKGFNRPEMETCLTCHNGTRASNACVDCHTRKHVPANHTKKDWLGVHGSKSTTIDCGKCHSWSPTDFCEECHKKRPSTHVGNWKTGHAERARTQSKGCYVCHDEKKFCGECH